MSHSVRIRMHVVQAVAHSIGWYATAIIYYFKKHTAKWRLQLGLADPCNAIRAEFISGKEPFYALSSYRGGVAYQAGKCLMMAKDRVKPISTSFSYTCALRIRSGMQALMK